MTDSKRPQAPIGERESLAPKTSGLAIAAALAGPLSIPLLWLVASGVGDFGGMAIWLAGGLLLVPLHLFCAVFLVVYALLRKRHGFPLGWVVTCGLVYYACAVLLTLPLVIRRMGHIGALGCSAGLLWFIGVISGCLLVVCLWMRRFKGTPARTLKLDTGTALAIAGLISVFFLHSASLAQRRAVASVQSYAVVTVLDASSHPIPGIKVDLRPNVGGAVTQVLMTDQEGMFRSDKAEYCLLIRLSKVGYRDCRLNIEGRKPCISWLMRDGRWSPCHCFIGHYDQSSKTTSVQVYIPATEGDDALPYAFDMAPWGPRSYRCLFDPHTFDLGKPDATMKDAALAGRFDRFCQRGASIAVDLDMNKKWKRPEENFVSPFELGTLEDQLRVGAYALVDDSRIKASTEEYLTTLQAAPYEHRIGGSGEIETMERFLVHSQDAPIRPYLILRLIYDYRRLQYKLTHDPHAAAGETWEGGADSDASKYAVWTKEASDSSDPLVRFFAGEIMNAQLDDFH